MMTASSVEFFPCRVQLMGLPRSTATTATASSGDLPTALVQRNTPNITQTTSTITYRRPPLAKVQGVSRNLFGSPKPGEINQLFQKEAQRQRSYVLQRYNFDIASGKPTTKQQHPTAAVVKANTNINERYLVTQIPGSLIERELQEHEQRLQKEKCSLNRSPPEEIKCSNFKQKATTNLSYGLKVLRNRTINPSITCQGDSTLPAAATSAAPGASLLLSSSSERYKPYSRQTLITDGDSFKYELLKDKKDDSVQIVRSFSYDYFNILNWPFKGFAIVF
uniref:Cyclin-dependent kinase inhibitor domain-containing protein n=1 Tax=Glossina pallidipes TaxID=7398 RepID=A0A1A9ZEB2_GLOPL